MGDLDQLQNELREKYPKLTMKRDGGPPAEFLFIYEGDNMIASVSISNMTSRGTWGEISLTLSGKDEKVPTFIETKRRLNNWLRKRFE